MSDDEVVLDEKASIDTAITDYDAVIADDATAKAAQETYQGADPCGIVALGDTWAAACADRRDKLVTQVQGAIDSGLYDDDSEIKLAAYKVQLNAVQFPILTK